MGAGKKRQEDSSRYSVLLYHNRQRMDDNTAHKEHTAESAVQTQGGYIQAQTRPGHSDSSSTTRCTCRQQNKHLEFLRETLRILQYGAVWMPGSEEDSVRTTKASSGRIPEHYSIRNCIPYGHWVIGSV